jgi:hypothetical protein
VLVVSDDGPGLLSPRPGHSGIGLVNTTARLARLYGDGAHLIAEPAVAGNRRGVRVTITLPIRTVPLDDDDALPEPPKEERCD